MILTYDIISMLVCITVHSNGMLFYIGSLSILFVAYLSCVFFFCGRYSFIDFILCIESRLPHKIYVLHLLEHLKRLGVVLSIEKHDSL